MIKNNLPTLITGIIGYSFVIAICSQRAIYNYACEVSQLSKDYQYCMYDAKTGYYKINWSNPYNRN